MKSLTAASILAIMLSSASASISVVEPWSDTVWKSGAQGLIQWTSDPKESANAMCHIQIMNGNPSDGQIVAYITEPQAPIPCTANEYKVGPLNDFTQGSYWVRIGQDDKWVYSHMFTFDGKGTVDTRTLNKPVPIRLAEKQTASAGPSNASTGMRSPSSAAGSAPASKPSAQPSGSKTRSAMMIMSNSRASASMSSSAKATESSSPIPSAKQATKDMSGADSFLKATTNTVLGTVIAGLMTYLM